MSINAVDVADRVECAIVGVVFPQADGEFVRVDTGSEWLRGQVVVDPSQTPVAVMPVAADAAVWEGCVTPGSGHPRSTQRCAGVVVAGGPADRGDDNRSRNAGTA